MPTISSLVVRLTADTRDLNRDLRQAKDNLQRFAREASGATRGAARSPFDQQTAAIAQELARTQSALTTAMAGGSREAQTLAARFHALTAAQRQEAVAAREALTALRDREGASRRLGEGMRQLGATMTAGVTAPLVALGVASVRSATQMDSLKRGLTAVVGSSEEAERQLVRLREVAKLPGLGRVEAIQGAIQLQAAGLSAELAEKSLLGFGNALASVGKGKADLDGVTLALTQISAKGKVSAEEINQLAERVPQIRTAMRDAFGTANTEALQKQGLTARRFIEGITAELLKLPRVTGGVQNAFENLGDVVGEALGEIGRNILPTLLPIVEKITARLTGLTREFAALPQPVRTLIISMAGIALAAGPVLLVTGQLLMSWNAVKVAAPVWANSLKSVGAALLAAPGWTKVAVAALAALALAWSTDFGGIRTATMNFVSWITPTLSDMGNEILAQAKGWLADFRQSWSDAMSGIKSDVGNAWAGIAGEMFAGFTRGLQAVQKGILNMPPALTASLEKLMGFIPGGKNLLDAVRGAAMFPQYVELRNWAEDAANMTRRDQPGGAKPRPFAGRDDPADPVKKKKELTPLQQEMLSLQGRLNAAWNTESAILSDLNPKVAELAGQFRHVAATGKAGIKLFEDVIRAETEAQKAIARARMDPGFRQAEEELQRVISGPQRLQQFKDRLLDLQLQIKELNGEDTGGLRRLFRDFGDVVGEDDLIRMMEATAAVEKLTKARGVWQQMNQLRLESRASSAEFEGSTSTQYTAGQRQAILMFGRDLKDLTQAEKDAGDEFLRLTRTLNRNRLAWDYWEKQAQDIRSATVVAGIGFLDAKQQFLAFAAGGDRGRRALEMLGVRLEQLGPAARKTATNFLQEMMRFEELSSVMETLVSGIQDVFRKGFENLAEEGFGGFFRSIYQGFRQLLIQMAAEFLSSQIRNALTNLAGGLFTKAAAWRPPMARAAGGPVMAGSPYLVGERGPELFLPRQSGTIMNQRQMATAGAGASYTINVNVSGQDTPAARANAGALADEIGRNLQRAARRNRGGR